MASDPFAASDSYAAFLREVATCHSGVSPSRSWASSPAAAAAAGRAATCRPTPKLRNSTRPTSNNVDPSEEAYDYRYLHVPASLPLHHPQRRQLSPATEKTRGLSAVRRASPHRHGGASSCHSEVNIGSLQHSFEKLYAVLTETEDLPTHRGRRHGRSGSPRESLHPPHSRPYHRQHRDAPLQIRIPVMDYEAEGGSAGINAVPSAIKMTGEADHAKWRGQREKHVSLHSSSPTHAVGKVLSPVLTSVETSVMTASPTSASSTSSSSTSSSPARQGQRRHRYRCPHCCHRCRSCQCVGRPCQRNCPRAHDTGSGHRTTAGRRTHVQNRSASVRLQWPEQPETSPGRPLSSSPHRRERRRPLSPVEHPPLLSAAAATATKTATVAVVSSTRGALKSPTKAEQTLREIAKQTCTCYWREFPELTMAVNPASHAAMCAYQAHEVLYADIMLGDTSKDTPVVTPRASRSSSASVEGAVDRPSRRQPQQRRRRQATQQLHTEAEATRPHGRAAVIGSTKRRTYLEIIMEAARDAPPRQQQQQQCRRPSKMARACSLGRATTATSAARASPPAPAPASKVVPIRVRPPTLPLTQSMSSSASQQDGDAAGAMSDEVNGSAEEETAGLIITEPEELSGDDKAATSSSSSRACDASEGVSADVNPLRSLSRPRCRPAVGVPGPGAYQVDLAYAASSAAHGIRGSAIPKAPRMPPVRSTTPGPGAYDMYQHEEDQRRSAFPGAATRAAAAADKEEGAETGASETSTGVDGVPQALKIGKGVVFASTGARQLQLQYGDAYVHNSTWAKRIAATPGPGAYNILDGDRFDQSKPARAARMGFCFPTSADGGHFITSLAIAASATALARAGDAPWAAQTVAMRSSLVVPWRDWAGGAFIGTSTTAFLAHPLFAGRHRRTLGQNACIIEEAAGEEEEGRAWKGVGSGVALRLTSQRFPTRAAQPPSTGVVTPSEDVVGQSAPVVSPGDPGPGSYETERALRWTLPSVPAVSMTFRHDRGPRGPLRSTAALLEDHVDGDGGIGESVGEGGPGPGTYDTLAADVWRLHRNPQWSFSTAARSGITALSAGTAANERAETAAREPGGPGPGAYDTEIGFLALQPSVARAIVGTAPRFVVEEHASGTALQAPNGYHSAGGALVGPGSYDVERGELLVHTRVKGGTLPLAETYAKDGTTAEANLPGPGTYTLPSPFPTGPSAYLGTTAPRFPWERAGRDAAWVDQGYLLSAAGDPPCGDNAATPGPGAYDVEAAIASLVHHSGAIIGRAPRGLLSCSGAGTAAEVGPGSYDLPPLPAGPSATISTARSGTAAEAAAAPSSPGPGLYDPVDVGAHATQAPSLARTSVRFPSGTGGSPGGATEVPGPGAYSLPGIFPSAGRGMAFETAPRFLQESGSGAGEASAVGPGSYDPYWAESAAATFAAAVGPAYSMGRAPRFPLGAAEGTGGGVPGPGAYEVVDLSPPCRSTTMGSAVSRPLPDGASTAEGPGPGAYAPQYDRVHPTAPRVVLAQAPTDRGREAKSGGVLGGSGLGPGQYDPQYSSDMRPSGVGYTFGSAVRANGDAVGADAPGPGAYEVRLTRDGYASDSAAVNKAPTFGTAARDGAASAPHLTSPGPGPGSYQPEVFTAMGGGFARATHAAHFGTAPRTLDNGGAGIAEGPGPGAYEPMPSAVWPTAPSVTFARAQATASPSEDNVAAGVVGGPGPNAYEPNVEAVRPTRPAHRLGIASRFDCQSREEEGGGSNGVGPGAYDIEAALVRSSQMPGVVAHSIPRAGAASAVASHLDEGVTFPGPGSYEVQAAYRATLPHEAAAILTGGGGAAAGDGVDPTPGPGTYAVPPPVPGLGAFAFPRATAGAAHTTASPGPGAYDVVDTAVRPATAGAGFGTAPRPTGDTRDGGPGPGAYSPNAEASSSVPPVRDGPSFGQAPRMPPITVEASGPGAEDGGGVGPGSYDPLTATVKGTAHRFGTAPRLLVPTGGEMDGEGLESVGPGSYAVEAADAHVRPRAPAYTMVAASASPLLLPTPLPTPGPGSYDNAAEVQRHARAAVMMMSRRSDAPRAETPGPNAYDTNPGLRLTLPSHVSGVAPAHTFGTAPTHRQAVAEQQEGSPGPGTYSPTFSFTAVSSGVAGGPVFGTAPRMPSVTTGGGEGVGVGPGAYDLPAPPATHLPVSFPQAPRSQVGPLPSSGDGGATGGPGAKDPFSPGPGAYDVGSAAAYVLPGGHNAGYTIPRGPRPVLRSGDPDASPLVGPGTYSPEGPATTLQHTGTSAAFGWAERPVNTLATSDTPGPGAYDPRVTGTEHAPSFGTASRMEPVGGSAGKNEIPGPGAYAVAAAFQSTSMAPTAPAAHFGTAERPTSGAAATQQSEAPGPGTYSLPDCRAQAFAAAPSFGYAARPDMVLNTNPGPGAYSSSTAWLANEGASFGYAARPDMVLNTNPGPGAYSSSTAWLANGGASFGYAARPDMVLNTNPGPGAYYREGADYTIGDAARAEGAQRTTFGLTEQRPHPAGLGLPTPGPGAYYSEASGREPSAMGPSFPRGKRIPLQTSSAPGPGAYHVETAAGIRDNDLHGPSFGQAERPGPELNRNPGPGAYVGSVNADVRGIVATRSAFFGSSERPDPKLNDNPGPGTYFRGLLSEAATTKPREATAPSKSRLPTAMETLRKLASVGYPLASSEAVTEEEVGR